MSTTTVSPPNKIYNDSIRLLKVKKISFNEFICRCLFLYLNDELFKRMIYEDIWKYGREYEKSRKDTDN
jgi:hypothetical protein